MGRPGLPFLGCGEGGQGLAGAAIADATGARLPDLPLTREGAGGGGRSILDRSRGSAGQRLGR